MNMREEWLTAAAVHLAPMIVAAGHAMPSNCRYACGFPKGGRKAIGQCWNDSASGDKTFEIFVSPELATPTRVLDVLLHEMIHAAVGLDQKHKGNFRKVAKAVGLAGKMTATCAGPELFAKLALVAATLGAYPHAELSPSSTNGVPKQTTRMHKAACACGYTVRVAAKWIAKGLPVCPCGGEMTSETKGEDDAGDEE